MAFSKAEISASTGGRGGKVVATSSPGTTVHTTGANDDDLDLVTLRFCNTQVAAVKLTVEWGGTTSPDDHIIQWIPGESGEVEVTCKRSIRGGASTAKVIRAFADTANVLIFSGEYIRMTP